MEDHSNKEVDENSILTAAELTRSFGADQSLTEILNISTENPSHLYWVPASQHPEIAPNEFENYVQALRTNVEKKKGNVKRRRSILSVSFTADDIISKTATVSTDNDNEQANGRQSALEALENKKQPSPSSLGRANSLINKENHANEYNNQLDEKMAKTRKEKLRRSISLHFTNPSDPGRIPDFLVFDRNSTALDQSPVLVPKAQRPLSRRGARTKFQRSSSIVPSPTPLTDDFHQPYRHSDSSFLTSTLEHRQQQQHKTISTDNLDLYNLSSSPSSSSSPSFFNDSNVSLDTSLPPPQHNNSTINDHITLNSTFTTSLPSSYSSPQLSINNDPIPLLLPDMAPISPSPSISNLMPSTVLKDDQVDKENKINDPPIELITAQKHSNLPSPLPSSSPLPPPPPPSSSSSSSYTSKPVPPLSSTTTKKSSWSWSFWSDDKKTKGDSLQPSTLSANIIDMKDMENDNNKLDNPTSLPPPLKSSTSTPTTSSSKQKFGFSSLFSRKPTSSSQPKSSLSYKNEPNSTLTMMPPKDFQLNKLNQQRLPLHIERTVYRLSHVKLANPRRPLRDQVIISNFMFWYLSIINQQQHQQHSSTSGHKHPSLPKTPQQIIAKSKKKKRPTNHKSRPSSSTSNGNPPPSNPSKNNNNGASPDKTLKQYMDGSKKASTGFVIPENYLKPATTTTTTTPSSSPTNKPTLHQQRHQRTPIRQTSSSSDEDEEDDDDDDDEDEDDDEDDEEVEKQKSKQHQKKNYMYNNNNKNNNKKLQPSYNNNNNQHQRYPTPSHQQRSYGNNVPLSVYNKKTAIS